MQRRDFLRLLGAAGAAPALPAGLAHAQSQAAGKAGQVLRIGFQKGTPSLILAKESGALERRLSELGFGLSWHEFVAGPPMLEALNVGSIDLATVGNTPTIFALAAGARLEYVGYENSRPDGEGILVKADSPLRELGDLRGRRIAFHKGSSAHHLVLAALEKAGLGVNDVNPVYLSPADARAAFEGNNVDAWAIWDPFFAQAELVLPVRILATVRSVDTTNNGFHLASRDFASRHPQVVQATLDVYSANEDWHRRAPDEVSGLLARSVGLDKAVFDKVLTRRGFRIHPLTTEILADQQRVADRLYRHGVLPKPVAVPQTPWRAA